jgi:hypothetical protein
MTQVRTSARPPPKHDLAYVHAILVDGVVRCIGKGQNARMYTHLIEARRSATRRARTMLLRPRMQRRLVDAVRSRADIREKIMIGGLSDRQAYWVESWLIAIFHRFWSQVCGAIDPEAKRNIGAIVEGIPALFVSLRHHVASSAKRCMSGAGHCDEGFRLCGCFDNRETRSKSLSTRRFS